MSDRGAPLIEFDRQNPLKTALDRWVQFVKVNEQWFRVIGIVGPQLTVQNDVGGLPAQDRNNLIYVPTMAAIFRLEDSYSGMKDEIDGLYLQVATGADSDAASASSSASTRRSRPHGSIRSKRCGTNDGHA
jgi:hypothetical protein